MEKQKNRFKQIKTILLSRFKKEKENQIIKERRKYCSVCKWNSKNQQKLSIGVRFIKFWSDFYSLVTFNSKKDVLGNCTACDICSIYYKTKEMEEDCEKGYWKSIVNTKYKDKYGN